MGRGKLVLESRVDTLDTSTLRDNNPKYIVIHATRNYSSFEALHKLHTSNGWAGVGYHLYLSGQGTLYQCRPYGKEGAHTRGFNTNSIGICFYAQDGHLTLKNSETGSKIISELKDSYGNLEVISHTLCQVIYNNNLLESSGFERIFPEVREVVNEDIFRSLQKEMERLAGTLGTSRHHKLKQMLKGFKNCPGELFYHFG